MHYNSYQGGNEHVHTLCTRMRIEIELYGNSRSECPPYWSGNEGVVEEHLLMGIIDGNYMLLPGQSGVLQDVVMTESELVAAEVALGQLHLVTAREDGNHEGPVQPIGQFHSQGETPVFKPSYASPLPPVPTATLLQIQKRGRRVGILPVFVKPIETHFLQSVHLVPLAHDVVVVDRDLRCVLTSRHTPSLTDCIPSELMLREKHETTAVLLFRKQSPAERRNPILVDKTVGGGLITQSPDGHEPNHVV